MFDVLLFVSKPGLDRRLEDLIFKHLDQCELRGDQTLEHIYYDHHLKSNSLLYVQIRFVYQHFNFVKMLSKIGTVG